MRISVILPTYSRVEVLERTLRAYLRQLRAGEDELLVVDDGSTDATPALLATVAAESGGVLRWWRQENAGPAAARNRALREAAGELILFAGDDVIPEPDLVAAHLAAHQALGGATVGWKGTAVLGKIQWHPDLHLTPFMRWLEEGGAQFAYGSLADGAALPPEMHYTSNLSLPRALLPADPVFDERFRAACWEDVDLGLRLAAAGVRLRYAAGALGLHWHPTTLQGAGARAERVGYYRGLLDAKHGLRAAARFVPTELLKRAAAPVFRAIPLAATRALGYRWTLAWPDFVGYRRFQREGSVLH